MPLLLKNLIKKKNIRFKNDILEEEATDYLRISDPAKMAFYRKKQPNYLMISNPEGIKYF
jgi:hypothetical protein